MVSWIICISVWTILILEIIYVCIVELKHRNRFNNLIIGNVYCDILVDKKQKNPYMRESVIAYFQLIGKSKRKGRYYLKYRKYDINTNTCSTDEYSMEYNRNDIIRPITQTNNMSIWQKYDNLTSAVSCWLEDIDYMATISDNEEISKHVKVYKGEINSYYKKIIV